MKSYVCSICGKLAEYEGPLPAVYPFCSPRCRMVDLGRWFRGQYAIERDLTPEDGPLVDSPGDQKPTSND